jgi:hypothetical protein
MIKKATKNPAPESAANTGLMWELCCLVVKGTVDGETGRWPLIPGIGAIVVVEATVDVG